LVHWRCVSARKRVQIAGAIHGRELAAAQENNAWGLIGHIVVRTALLIETDYSPPVELQFAIYLPLTVVFAGIAATGERRSRRR
jgi:hypothetical protein